MPLSASLSVCYEKFFHAKPRSREKEKFWWASLPLSPPFSWFQGVPKGHEKLSRKVAAGSSSRLEAAPTNRGPFHGFRLSLRDVKSCSEKFFAAGSSSRLEVLRGWKFFAAGSSSRLEAAPTNRGPFHGFRLSLRDVKSCSEKFFAPTARSVCELKDSLCPQILHRQDNLKRFPQIS